MADTEAPPPTGDNPNSTGKIPATPEGMMVAYGSLVVMALIPIFLGSYRSVKSQQEQKDNHEKTGERPETMTRKDAMMFPIIASCALNINQRYLVAMCFIFCEC